ncbi:type II CAAX endopeptidase family protein [Spirulina sp. CS-785/01]|uniref:CPBP family intramembrane glutamic endopeptidase n=1 Tax=Spirulina sp. CS-785/01 TaxID=3021716 RepID=UPI00232ED2CE|nr:type II CAAX endopeptidase family protein [Spirulina sp. CS-785/01]MDB9313105.1 type II CAAX endopeptidase family protein [Spirulina sp. CS-785/01]
MKLNPTPIAQFPAPLRLGIFVGILLIIWLPFALPLYLLLEDDNLTSILTLTILYLEFLTLAYFWGKRVHTTPHPFEQYGWQWQRKMGIEWVNGLAIGFCQILLLFVLMALLGWAQVTPPPSLLPIIAQGLLSALGIGLAEELLFRGWFLSELEKDYSPTVALWSNALIFAILHFIKPLSEIIRTFPQFPGLVLLGLILVWAKRRHQNRLGFSIGLHTGLVWGYYIISVGELVEYTQQVPPWVTGIDLNPLAGVMGLLGLGGLAWWIKPTPHQSKFD